MRQGHEDFQGKDWAIEVKTTATNGSDRLTINGERQLDDALLDRLFLYHLSVEVSRKNGQTLNRAIEDLRKALAADTIALHRFNTGLIHAGYFDEHAPMYQDRCYKIRWEQAYRISGDFPVSWNGICAMESATSHTPSTRPLARNTQ